MSLTTYLSLVRARTNDKEPAVLGEDSPDPEPMSKPVIQPSTEKLPFVERLANSITKRKRSTPQKFLGKVFALSHPTKRFNFSYQR